MSSVFDRWTRAGRGRLAIYGLLNVLVVLMIGGFSCSAGARPWQSANGTLSLSVVDADSSQPTPVRLEMSDDKGQAYIAEDALRIGALGIVDTDSKTPWKGTLEEWRRLCYQEVPNPFTKTTQFYSVGTSRFSLPAGTYRLRVFKGIEYRVQAREVRIEKGKTLDLTIPISRWIDMPQRGWYGADDHLHIARPHKEMDPVLLRWMQGEDLHVANLLQWGHSWHFHNTIQYAHGREGVYQEGDSLLAPGQENPRINFLGHAIILGAPSPIHFPEDYLAYPLPFEEAQRTGALAGYAHAGKGRGRDWDRKAYGLGINLGHGPVNFVEVLQFKKGGYGFWYDALNSGFRVAPTAGTDYMNPGTTLPGRDRFYTRVDGPLTYEAWLQGVRQGRTFVTNGPMLEFEVNGKGMGEEAALQGPGTLRVRGRVRFNPESDDVHWIQVIKDGDIIRAIPRERDSSDIPFQFDLEAREPMWLALRVTGEKVGEAGNFPSEAHSAAIYVTLENSSAHPRAKSSARTWVERLEELERLLAEENIPKLADPKLGDGITVENLRKNRSKLLKTIQTAKGHFMSQGR